MRYISRSSHQAFRQCMRAGYWRYLSGPFDPESKTRGLEPARIEKPLALGIAWHKGAEALLQGSSAYHAASIAINEAEQYPSLTEVEKNWLLAVCLAWAKSARDDFFAQYDVLSVEDEIEVRITPNVILQARADAIIQERSSGDVYVLNWKTASDIKGWNKKWFFDVQAWTECVAAESKHGTPIAGCLFYGIYKGPIWNSQMTSRLIYGYKQELTGGEVIYAPDYKAGWKRFEAWNESFPFGEGIPAWIEWLPKDFLKGHFCISAPQIPQPSVVENWLRQLARVETDIDHIIGTGGPDDVQDYFLQNFGDHCPRCPYVDLCLQRATPEALIEASMLRPRVDHHAMPVEEE